MSHSQHRSLRTLRRRLHACGRAFSHRSVFPPAARLCSRLFREDSAQAIVLVALAMVLIVGFTGLAVDVGQLRYARRQLQNAADAAAIAGAAELKYCAGTNACSIMQTAAQDALTENGLSSSTLKTNCASNTATGVALTLNNGPCALGSTTADPHYHDANYVEVVVTQPQPTYFARILGINSVPISARAEAALAGGSNCMFALDPSGSNAITVDLLAVVNSQCGVVDESSSNSALTCNLLAYMGASQIGVVGSYSGFLCLGGFHPTPKTHITNPGDPLSYLTKPTVPSCGTNTNTTGSIHGSPHALNITGNATLYPDAAYCGGINIALGANVTFQPGTYVLTSTNAGSARLPGGLQIDLLSNVSGNGVTFYNYGPSGGVTFLFSSISLGGVSLIAPTSGAYSGILFYQDPGNTSQATIIGTSSWNTVLQGTYYFPSAPVVFALDGAVDYNILVAYDIEFAALTYGGTTLQSNFTNNYSTLADGSPIKGNGAVLVE